MRYHSQNLNEDRRGDPKGSMFWHGRAWFYGRREPQSELFHIEWLFGKYARDFGIHATFGYGDSDAGVCLHIGLPWLFSVYLVLPYVCRCRESQTGIAIHNGAFWIYPFTDQHESRRDHPWWKKNYAFHFPWTYDWYSTEILEHKANLPGLAKTVYMERKKPRLGSGDWRRDFDARKDAAKLVSETYDYTYTLKSGEVQRRKAAVYVDRMTWRALWWPIIPRQQVRTSINITFDGEVGEGTGSWKGGCTGCGYDMLHAETPLECLLRMERERKFDR